MNDIRFGCVEKAVETVTLSTMSNGVGKNTVLDIDADMSDSAVFNRDHKPRTQQILKGKVTCYLNNRTSYGFMGRSERLRNIYMTWSVGLMKTNLLKF